MRRGRRLAARVTFEAPESTGAEARPWRRRAASTVIVDTGAEVTAISATLARKLGLDTAAMERRALIGAFGTATRPAFRGALIWFGGAEPRVISLPWVAVRARPTESHPRPRDPEPHGEADEDPDVNILGTDALRRLRARLVADFHASRGYIEW